MRSQPISAVFKPGDRVHMWQNAWLASTTGTVTGTTPEGRTLVRWDDNQAVTSHLPQHLEPAGEPMSTDPRIEAAAVALLSFETSTPLDDVPGPLGRDVYRRATAALAAADNAATITTRDQLAATPAGTVLIDSYRVRLGGDVYQKSSAGTYWQAGPQGEFRTIQLPARVIHRGTE